MEPFSNSGKTVLVTGATGQKGGAVAARMLEKGWKLRALTRNVQSHAAKALAQQGVEIMQGDLENPASIEAAVRGVYGLRQRYPELRLKSLEDWLYTEGWEKHARPVGFRNGAWDWKH